MLDFPCTDCGARIRIDDTRAGQRVVCTNCNTRQTAPLSPPAPPPPKRPAFTPKRALTDPLLTTADDIAGHQITAYLGIARGISIRSTAQCAPTTHPADHAEAARQQAQNRMLDHARQLTANAVIAMRYDATELSPGLTEIIAYGTAVRIIPILPAPRKPLPR